MKLTPGAIQRYIKGGGLHCPYCQGGNLRYTELQGTIC
jgi:hypothetical protein